ncbi:MAG: hypothetical protein QNJ05_04130 [Woeseiaceae bacterium]|nr:hypothetical protein [Woeseiaceae bacterium]
MLDLNALLVVSALLSLLAAGMLIGCVRQTRRGRLLKAGGRFAGGVSFGALGSFGLLLGVSYLGYERLTNETVIGQVEFIATGSGRYSARLMRPEQTDRLFELDGDEWQIDARVISWSAPATILGLEPVYELERISGRYSDIDRERTENRTVYSLVDKGVVDLWSLAREYPALMPGVDAYYGTATYVPMADGARYEVSLSRDALIARAANEQAERALGAWRAE